MITNETIGIAEARCAIEAILGGLTEQDNPAAIAVVDASGIRS